MKKILIIGAEGIGSHLVLFLSKLQRYSLVGADSDKYDKGQERYQNCKSHQWGINKAKAMSQAFDRVSSIEYDIMTDKQLKGYDLVICCADNLDVRRLVYRQGHGSHSKVKWLDLRAQGRNGLLTSYLQDTSLSEVFLDGPEGSFSCQAEDWDGKTTSINMMHIVVAAMGSQWVQKYFNKEEVDSYLTVNL